MVKIEMITHEKKKQSKQTKQNRQKQKDQDQGEILDIDETIAAYQKAFSRLKASHNALDECNFKWIFEDYYVKIDQVHYYNQLAKLDRDFIRKIQINQKDHFQRYILESTIHVTNQVNVLSGPPGDGKSLAAIKIMKLTIEAYKEYRNHLMKIHYAFNPPELLNKLTNAKDGDFVQCDEWAKTQGQSSKAIGEQLTNILATVRFKEKCINICSPMGVIVIGMTSLLIPFGKNKQFLKKQQALKMIKQGLSYSKIKKAIELIYEIPFTREDYIGLKTGRIRLDPKEMKTRLLWYSVTGNKYENMKMFLNGVIYLQLDTIQDLLPAYEKAKKDNYEKLEKNKGGVGGVDEDRTKHIEKLAQDLLDYAIKKGHVLGMKLKKKKLDSLIFRSQIGTRLTLSEKEVLKEICIEFNEQGYFKKKEEENQAIIETNQKTIEAIDQAVNFEYDELELLEEIKHSPHPTLKDLNRDIEIYKKIKYQFQTQKQINLQYSDFATNAAVGQIKRRVNGLIADHLGRKYELYLKPILENYFENVLYSGLHRHPDFEYFDQRINKKVFLNVKTMDFNNDIVVYYKKMNAEIIAARNYFKANNEIPIVKLHLFNRFNKRIYIREVPEGYLTNFMPITKKHKFVINIAEFSQSWL